MTDKLSPEQEAAIQNCFNLPMADPVFSVADAQTGYVFGTYSTYFDALEGARKVLAARGQPMTIFQVIPLYSNIKPGDI